MVHRALKRSENLIYLGCRRRMIQAQKLQLQPRGDEQGSDVVVKRLSRAPQFIFGAAGLHR